MTDLYRILNLLPAAATDEIRVGYDRERARIIAEAEDPDDAAQQLAALDEAYATLSEPSRRAAYDRSRTLDDSGALLPIRQPTPTMTSQVPAAPIVQQSCPHCGALNPVQATMCSQCGKQVSRPCPVCAQPVVLGQTVCTRCNTFIPEYDQRRFAEGLATTQRVQNERAESDAKAEVIGEAYQSTARRGAIFWTILLLILCIVAAVAIAVFKYAAQ